MVLMVGSSPGRILDLGPEHGGAIQSRRLDSRHNGGRIPGDGRVLGPFT